VGCGSHGAFHTSMHLRRACRGKRGPLAALELPLLILKTDLQKKDLLLLYSVSTCATSSMVLPAQAPDDSAAVWVTAAGRCQRCLYLCQPMFASLRHVKHQLKRGFAWLFASINCVVLVRMASMGCTAFAPPARCPRVKPVKPSTIEFATSYFVADNQLSARLKKASEAQSLVRVVEVTVT
jgi:hypothetical protein